jgi:ATP-dependent DNA helicase RecQ
LAHSSAQQILRNYFGYETFRGHQQTSINHIIAGQDALVLMPTGSGKSICDQIPAMVRSGVGIVISPLITLMQDQVDAVRQLGIRAAFLNSSMTPENARGAERELVAGELDLMYVAPERLLTPGFQKLLHECRLVLFAIDQAHCVLQCGHDSRPENCSSQFFQNAHPDPLPWGGET